jgi:sugar phosphate isomerase/epimerase
MKTLSKIGLQMYTLRDEAAKDFVGTLRAVANLGYDGVEFAGYGGLSATQLAAALKDLNLLATGSHVSYQRLLEATDEEIAYNLAIGSDYIICPYLADEFRTDLAAWQEVFLNLERIGQRCAEKGIILCYHNHEFELTQQLDGIPALDKLFESVPASALQVELDTCWVYDAGYDPIEYIHKYAGRVPLIHLKDIQKKDSGRGLTVELGQGEINLAAVAKAAMQAGAEWIIVEQDICQKPPLVSVENSMNWVKKNLRL